MSATQYSRTAADGLHPAVEGLVDTMHEPATQKSPAAPRQKLRFPLFDVLAWIGVPILLLAGWLNRHSSNLTAETGTGYWLGIIGGVLMLLLLTYPMRKHMKAMRRLGNIKHWFRAHMIFGVAGPVLILFHSTFSLGSLNSNLALFSMLAVAISGLIGRFLYSRIHMGLYGQRATLPLLRQELAHDRLALAKLDPDKAIANSLANLEQSVIKERSLPVTLLKMPLVNIHISLTRYRIRKKLDRAVNAQGYSRSVRRQYRIILKEYTCAMRRAVHLSAYERFFSLWHILHMPMYMLLIAAGITHVIAVHLY
ncbi:MAG TPA: pyridine nucleotide-disulfide oxidoreductase [Gammaproteobacteria bacterium]|nr:pyridine nucleotide-disulfide oxidoreductase [Gammaproteobacteria bacterium]